MKIYEENRVSPGHATSSETLKTYLTGTLTEYTAVIFEREDGSEIEINHYGSEISIDSPMLEFSPRKLSENEKKFVNENYAIPNGLVVVD